MSNKEAVICLLCRYLINKHPNSNYITFGNKEINNIICNLCLDIINNNKNKGRR